MNIAIFGGSFDPVHTGHIHIVQEALKNLDISKLYIVPTYLNLLKKEFHIEPKVRYELLKKVFKKFESVEICNYEIKQNKPTASIETVKYLQNITKPDKIYFIIGADNLKDLDKWKDIEKLKNLVQFVVAKRDGFNTKDLQNYKTLDVNIDISSSKLREKLDINYIPDEIKQDILKLNKKG